MCKMCKTHQDVQNVENPPKCAKCGKPTKMCKSPGCALLTSPSEYLLQQKVSPNAPHEMWDGILLWAFHLHVFRVGLFGVFGPDKKRILMYYHQPPNTMLQCISQKLVRHFDGSWLRIYGLLQLASMFLTPTQIFYDFSLKNGLKPTKIMWVLNFT